MKMDLSAAVIGPVAGMEVSTINGGSDDMFCHRLMSDCRNGGYTLIRVCTLNRTTTENEQGKPSFRWEGCVKTFVGIGRGM